MSYTSKFTGAEIDTLLEKVQNGMGNEVLEEMQSQLNKMRANPLTFEALEDGLSIKLKNQQDGFEYKIDDGDWERLYLNKSTPAINAGQKISFRANATPVVPAELLEGEEVAGIGTFVINKYVKASGSPMSLLYKDEIGSTEVMPWAFAHLFKGCDKLTTAPELPATTIGDYCYYRMFQGCSNLLQAPELPALVLAPSCYYSMFDGCSTLSQTPKLPASILAEKCYYCMFYNCSGITTATELAAKNLEHSCYYGMFFGCTSLSEGVKLPARTLSPYCYAYMFQSCESLINAPELHAMELADYCYNAMFAGCTNLKTSPKLPATTLAPYCYSFMFQNCTSLIDAGEILPAIELSEGCYMAMYINCVSLEKAPELPATSLPNFAYVSMFQACSNLKYVKAAYTSPQSTMAAMTIALWLEGVASDGVLDPGDNNNPGWVESSYLPANWKVVSRFVYCTWNTETQRHWRFRTKPDTTVIVEHLTNDYVTTRPDNYIPGETHIRIQDKYYSIYTRTFTAGETYESASVITLPEKYVVRIIPQGDSRYIYTSDYMIDYVN